MSVSVKIWDPFLRLFHWALVISFAVVWVTGDTWESLHIWAGYAAGTLVVFRLLWGFVGPKYARFGQFVRSPEETLSYLKDIALHREARYLGHNPAGAAMILALLAVMSATVLSGWLYETAYFGRGEWLEETHELLANMLLGLVILHIGGVMLACRRHKENLVRAMVTGWKHAPGERDVY